MKIPVAWTVKDEIRLIDEPGMNASASVYEQRAEKNLSTRDVRAIEADKCAAIDNHLPIQLSVALERRQRLGHKLCRSGDETSSDCREAREWSRDFSRTNHG
jgi:hypothetical protein